MAVAVACHSAGPFVKVTVAVAAVLCCNSVGSVSRVPGKAD